MRVVEPVPLSEIAELKHAASRIQDAKRAAINGHPSAWPDDLPNEFALLEQRSNANPYIRPDLDYFRNRSSANRSFAYVVTYDTFVTPARDASGDPSGEPRLISVVKLGDGGREDGRSAGRASGSIICRTVRSYWEEGNTYRPILQGIAIPGNDTRISQKIAKRLGSSEARLQGDVWHGQLLDLLSVDELLQMMQPSGR